MSAIFFIAGLITLLILIFGALIGHSLAEQTFNQRSRRQAAVQRNLNEQRRALEVRREAIRLLEEAHRPNNTHLDE